MRNNAVTLISKQFLITTVSWSGVLFAALLGCKSDKQDSKENYYYYGDGSGGGYYYYYGAVTSDDKGEFLSLKDSEMPVRGADARRPSGSEVSILADLDIEPEYIKCGDINVLKVSKGSLDSVDRQQFIHFSVPDAKNQASPKLREFSIKLGGRNFGRLFPIDIKGSGSPSGLPNSETTGSLYKFRWKFSSQDREDKFGSISIENSRVIVSDLPSVSDPRVAESQFPGSIGAISKDVNGSRSHTFILENCVPANARSN